VSSPSGIPVAAIREAARLAVEAGSLRAVARAVGLSPMGLRNFIHGREPYSATRRKLNAWFLEHGQKRPEHAEATARAALAALLEGIAEPERDAAARELLRAVAGIYAERGARAPGWLRALLGAG